MLARVTWLREHNAWQTQGSPDQAAGPASLTVGDHGGIAAQRGYIYQHQSLGKLLMCLESELLDDHILKISLEGRLDVEGTQAIDMQFTALTATKKAALLVDVD